MWFDEMQTGWPWSGLWYGYIRCGCGGIRRTEGLCPACNAALTEQEPLVVRGPDGQEIRVPQNIHAGGEAGPEDYLYLDMIEREWKRPVTDADRARSFCSGGTPSPRAAIVVLFWSYFETRIERLIEASMRNLPAAVTEDLLNRYSSVGARMDRLYRILFSTSYRADLNALGFERVGQHLDRVQERRNAFAHGEPQAIDDALVEAVVENLKNEHEAWLAVYNRRVARAT
jgi:hypothetical protein